MAAPKDFNSLGVWGLNKQTRKHPETILKCYERKKLPVHYSVRIVKWKDEDKSPVFIK